MSGRSGVSKVCVLLRDSAEQNTCSEPIWRTGMGVYLSVIVVCLSDFGRTT